MRLRLDPPAILMTVEVTGATLSVVALLLIAALAFLLGRITAPERGVVISTSDVPGWIEVRRDGELQSEWQASFDPEYAVLAARLKEP